MKYRDHRGSLHESMKTVQVVHSKEELIAHLNTQGYLRPIMDISFDHTIYDPRTGWDTWYVIAHTEKSVLIVGMSDSDSFDKPESNATG